MLATGLQEINGIRPTTQNPLGKGCHLCKQQVFLHKACLKALKHYIDYLLGEANKLQRGAARDFYLDCERDLKIACAEHVKPLVKDVQKWGKVAGEIKLERDGTKWRKRAPLPIRKGAMEKMMVDVHCVHNYLHNNDVDDVTARKLRYGCCANMAYTIYENAPVGRPGEWALMKESAIKETLHSVMHHLIE